MARGVLRRPLPEPFGLSIDPMAFEVTDHARKCTRRPRRRADAEALVRVINQLTTENRRIRRQLTAPEPRRFAEAEQPESRVNLSALVRQLADSLGLTVPGMRANCWRIEPAAGEASASPRPAARAPARSRLKVVAEGEGRVRRRPPGAAGRIGVDRAAPCRTGRLPEG
ncbi:hypothetical protein [Streptomyces sp. GS7]|uniref:hypothetical protein n=1 Tax=Streptomyces sp. GS7 TaxID=2692234 RepID=UPI001317634F|nr:hypothetical protein [Streptomyces sp. GS7]QHC22344.1 hypothetical protein GR130_13825 [Streptomyces sp. GS7]